MRKFVFSIVLLALGLLMLSIRLLRAADIVVGTGTPASCTEAAFDSAWNSIVAGTARVIKFNCGGAAHAIAFTTEKQVLAATEIVVDGENLITLDGQRNDGAGAGTRLFRLNQNGGLLTLQNIVLTNGKGNSAGCSVCDGGAAWVKAGTSLRLDHVSITNSTANNGGAVYTEGSVTALNSMLTNNSTTVGSSGGAVYIFDGTLFMDSVAVNGNHAGYGGAVYNRGGVATITNTTIDNNSVTNNGGGVVNDSSMIITNTTISENSANIGGGTYNYGTTNIINSTISGNTATMIAGGLANLNGTTTLNFTTVSSNNNANVTGIYRHIGTINLNQSVVNAGTTGANCGANAGGIPINGSANGNFSSDASCTTTAGTGVTVNANLLLGLLAANGGTTRSHLPQVGSPLIDAVSDCSLAGSPATDQRGAARPVGVACDVGSIEANGVAATPTPTPTLTPQPSATPMATMIPSNRIYLPIVTR